LLAVKRRLASMNLLKPARQQGQDFFVEPFLMVGLPHLSMKKFL